MRRTAAWVCFAASAATTALGVVVTVRAGLPVFGGDAPTSWAVALSTGLLGAFVVTRHPGSRVGWLFLAIAVCRGITGAAVPWVLAAYRPQPGHQPLPHGEIAAYLQACLVAVVLPVAAVQLTLFPDDRRDRAARPVRWLAAASFALLGVVLPVLAWPFRGPWLALDGVPSPDTPLARVGSAVFVGGLVLGVVAIVGALVVLVVRARRERGAVRWQILWCAYGAAVGLVVNLAANVTGLVQARPLGALALLTGIGFGIFRYRLYDLDRLINRTLVYGLMTVAALAVYGALAVVAGTLTGTNAGAAAAAFVVALLLRPLRDLSQDLIDRAFARRAHSGAAIMRDLARRVGHERVDPAGAVEALRRALRDPSLLVYFPLRASEGLVDPDGNPAVLPEPDGATVTEVGPRGEVVAVLVHAPADPFLLAAVTRAAAVVLEHARVQAELLVRLAEVRASRARLVATADAERRRIERDLHDGAQQRLVGLAVHVQSARRRIERTAPVDELLTFTVGQLHAAVGDIRALVHGILPPALATSGLGAALADLARPGEVEVELALGGRFDPIGEATAWFVACEGVANARKHAPGATVVVRAAAGPGAVTVTVADDGPGGATGTGEGLRGLRDRVEACAGTFTVHSPPGQGTVLTAILPEQR
ncbi:histidine kinase [Dactylosporangium sp. CS-033363]|uniref:sensor histidine kinase n=1 Tax=Dactylosporangium sp. CS-033363 TaxID=3239935 RepID=UPI003D94F656